MYQQLTREKPPGIEWNFTKFLIDKRGRIVERFNHDVPFEAIEAAVKALL